MSETTTSLVGTRVRVDSFYSGNNVALIGTFGTVQSSRPDSDGDVQVMLDGTGGIYYAHTWTVLGEGDTLPESTPSGPADGATLPETHYEAQLNALIDAVYSGAKRNGYMSLLPQLFDEAGIPLRPAKRTAQVRGLRVVSPNTYTEMDAALKAHRSPTTPDEVTVTLNRAVADFAVTLPWVEQEHEGERPSCYDLNNALSEDDFASVPDEFLIKVGLAVGYGASAANVRRNLTKHSKAGSEYGISLTCDLC